MRDFINIGPRVVRPDSTVTVDHTVQTFVVTVRSMGRVSSETIKNLIEKKYEVCNITEQGSTAYVR